jgi:hypothetical protein
MINNLPAWGLSGGIIAFIDVTNFFSVFNRYFTVFNLAELINLNRDLSHAELRNNLSKGSGRLAMNLVKDGAM